MRLSEAASFEQPASTSGRYESRCAPAAEERSKWCGRTRGWTAIALPLLALYLCALLSLARVELSLLAAGRAPPAAPLPLDRSAVRIRIRVLSPPTRGQLVRLPRDALRRALLGHGRGSDNAPLDTALLCVRVLCLLRFRSIQSMYGYYYYYYKAYEYISLITERIIVLRISVGSGYMSYRVVCVGVERT